MSDGTATEFLARLGDLYLWLSVAFDVPQAAHTTDAFAELGAGTVMALFPDSGPDEPGGPGDGGERLVSIQREYARLFLGPPHALVRPYESCYFGDDLLMTERTHAVRAFYELAGVAFDSATCQDPPDHITVELAFLAMICADSERAVDEREQIEQRFLAEHLGQWGLIFVDRILATTKVPYYRAAARILALAVERRAPTAV